MQENLKYELRRIDKECHRPVLAESIRGVQPCFYFASLQRLQYTYVYVHTRGITHISRRNYNRMCRAKKKENREQRHFYVINKLFMLARTLYSHRNFHYGRQK